MVAPPELRHRRVVVWGLGRFGGGVGVARWLCAQRAEVTVVDRARAGDLAESVSALDGLPIQFHLGGEHPAAFAEADLVVVNPAVPRNRSELFRRIVDSGRAWTTEINLFLERCPCPILGVTGSFGKSTAATLLASALRGAHHGAVHLGGNIGGSLLGDLEAMSADDRVVLELSDAQLLDVPRIERRPDFAVITNIVPHHLERHASFAAYARAKCNIFAGPSAARAVVIGPVAAGAQAVVQACLDASGCEVLPVQTPEPPLRTSLLGAHNAALAAQVWTLLRRVECATAPARAALESFGGLPHRLERIACVAGVTFINDSKSTSPACTKAAVDATPGTLVAIVGGSSTGESLGEAARTLARRCRAVITVGASAGEWADSLSDAGARRVESATSVSDAVRAAFAAASEGDSVLFSPGGPSFDEFPNYEHRGRAFCDAIARIAGAASPAAISRP